MTITYELRGDKDELLYVGVTDDWRKRAKVHRCTKPWWPEVARVEMRQHADRFDALLDEYETIQAKGPRYNRRWWKPSPPQVSCHDLTTPPIELD